jgi:hypothetical protein
MNRNNSYSELQKRIQELKGKYPPIARERELKTSSIPSKARAKRAASQNPFLRKDKQLLSKLPGSSRSVTVDAIKAIAHTKTGCIVTSKKISAEESRRNANTTQGNYNRSILK